MLTKSTFTAPGLKVKNCLASPHTRKRSADFVTEVVWTVAVGLVADKVKTRLQNRRQARVDLDS